MWLALLGVAWAADISVAPGSDWCGPVNAAAPGDRVLLEAGPHDGPCVLRASGSASAPVVLEGAVGSWIQYSGTSSNVLDVEASHVELRGLTLGPSAANIDAIKIKSGSHIAVVDCSFHRVGGISIAANSADSEGIRIEGNALTELQATGIYLGCHDGSCRAADYLIADNLIDGVVSSGIGYGMEMKLNSFGVVRHNAIFDTQGPGIEVYGSTAGDGTLVDGNLVVGSTNDAALEIGGGPAEVVNNVVVGGPAGGIYAYDYGGRDLQQGVHIVGNTAVGAGGAAVRVSSWRAGRDLVLANNAAHQRTGAGPSLPVPISGVDAAGNLDCATDCWADLAALDVSPAGPLLGAAVAGYGTAHDYCGAPRAGAVGAVEAALSGPLTTDTPRPCAGLPQDTGGSGDTGATDTDTDGVDTDSDPDPVAEPSGCGCSGVPAASAWALLPLAFALRRKRPLQGTRW